MTIIQGDCLEVLKQYPDNHFTTIITDPPYGLSFMGKKWDYDVPSIEVWKECLRVLKSGGTALIFAGTRTQHRMAVNIEDSGFMIKDCLMWIYGSGFPKGTDVGKKVSGFEGYKSHALKPAYEPIIMAMKPNDGTYAGNALKWGVSGINVEKCRIGKEKIEAGRKNRNTLAGYNSGFGSIEKPHSLGRFPANIILDEEAGKLLDEQTGVLQSGPSYNGSGGASRFFYCAKASKSERNAGCEVLDEKGVHRYSKGVGKWKDSNAPSYDTNFHPTVKPLALMEYLINLVMPPKDGLLLDPFAGSGTTLVASKKLGYNAIGIERESEYCEIAKARIKNVKPDNQMDLFKKGVDNG